MMMRHERRREARGYGGAPTRDRGVSFVLAWRSRYSQGELLHGVTVRLMLMSPSPNSWPGATVTTCLSSLS
jgi:hypothetical protein